MSLSRTAGAGGNPPPHPLHMFSSESWYMLLISLLCTFIPISLSFNALLDPQIQTLSLFQGPVSIPPFPERFLFHFRKKLSLSPLTFYKTLSVALSWNLTLYFLDYSL